MKLEPPGRLTSGNVDGGRESRLCRLEGSGSGPDQNLATHPVGVSEEIVKAGLGHVRQLSIDCCKCSVVVACCGFGLAEQHPNNWPRMGSALLMPLLQDATHLHQTRFLITGLTTQ